MALRRFQISPNADTEPPGPGLAQDPTTGHVVLVDEFGRATDLNDLIAKLDRSTLLGENADEDLEIPPGASVLSMPWAPVAAGQAATRFLGIIPYDGYFTSVNYVPATDVAFPAYNAGTDTVTSRRWVLRARRPAGRFVNYQARAAGEIPDIAEAPATLDGVTLVPGDLVLNINQHGPHGIELSRHNALFLFTAEGEPLVKQAGWYAAAAIGDVIQVTEGSANDGFWEVTARENDSTAPLDHPSDGFWFEPLADLNSGSGVIDVAILVVDGEHTGPLEQEDPLSDLASDGQVGFGTAGGTLAAGVPVPFYINELAAHQLRAGDTLEMTTEVQIDTALWRDDFLAAHPVAAINGPADPGGILWGIAVATRQGTSGFAPTIVWDPDPDESLDDPLKADPSRTWPDENFIVGRDGIAHTPVEVPTFSPDQIDPGGGGGPPKYFCFEWFSDSQGHPLRWGLDWPGWIDFGNELRARGMNEEDWACSHPDLARCINAGRVDWTPPAHFTGAGYPCLSGDTNPDVGGDVLSLELGLAVPARGTYAGYLIAATSGVVITILSREVVRSVNIYETIAHGFANIVDRSSIIWDPDSDPPATPNDPRRTNIFTDPLRTPGQIDAEETLSRPIGGYANFPWGSGARVKVRTDTKSVTKTVAKLGVLDVVRTKKSPPGACYIVGLEPRLDMLPLPETGWDGIIQPGNVTAGVIGALALSVTDYPDAYIYQAWCHLELYVGKARPGALRAAKCFAWPARPQTYGRGPVFAGIGKKRMPFLAHPRAQPRLPEWIVKWDMTLVYRRGNQSPTFYQCSNFGTEIGIDTWSAIPYSQRSDDGYVFGVASGGGVPCGVGDSAVPPAELELVPGDDPPA